jgi:hypothetical protein
MAPLSLELTPASGSVLCQALLLYTGQYWLGVCTFSLMNNTWGHLSPWKCSSLVDREKNHYFYFYDS